MGYSHYWYRPLVLPSHGWRSFLADWTGVQNALLLRGLALAGPGGEGPPILEGQFVAFNGAGKARYEDFFFARRYQLPERMLEDGRYFSFCKTVGLSYDLAVTACLLVAKRRFGDLLEVSSDGQDEDWQATRDLCHGLLGYGRRFRITGKAKLIDCRS